MKACEHEVLKRHPEARELRALYQCEECKWTFEMREKPTHAELVETVLRYGARVAHKSNDEQADALSHILAILHVYKDSWK